MCIIVADLDQPYCTILETGRWICTVTANNETEGHPGEHVTVFFSDDRGATWQPEVTVEPSPINRELANAYSMIVASNPGVLPNNGQRVYVIYNMNVDNVTTFPDGTPVARVDMMGKFEMRFSDDNGATWSEQRYNVPYRLTPTDYENDWKGNTTIMWTVDQIKIRDGVAYFAFTKIGHYILGPPEEMWVMRSTNILNATDPDDIEWTLLPHGEHGVKPIAGFENTNIEEVLHCFLPSRNSRLYLITIVIAMRRLMLSRSKTWRTLVFTWWEEPPWDTLLPRPQQMETFPMDLEMPLPLNTGIRTPASRLTAIAKGPLHH